jgi:hypothetical protein
MKTYKQLPIPEDSAWERIRLFDRLHWKIRYFLTGCRNLIKWAPTIYHDRGWDGNYILYILQKKIEYQREYLVSENRHTRINIDNRDMTLVLNLIERVREEHYQLECIDYWDFEIIFNNERYDEFLSKYPSSVRGVVKEHGEQNDKQRLCMLVSY